MMCMARYAKIRIVEQLFERTSFKAGFYIKVALYKVQPDA
jgi:hypothetical protein